MVEENILCVKINGQVISINNAKDVCIPNGEETSDSTKINSYAKINNEGVHLIARKCQKERK